MKESTQQYDSERVVAARRNKGYSQEELAFAADLSLRTVQRIEKGSVRPRLYSLKAIATALDCTLGQFQPITEAKSPQQEKVIDRMTLAVYSVVIFPILPLLIQALLWYPATEIMEEEDLRCRQLIHFQGRWLVALVLTLVALPIVTLLLTGQVSYGNFPVAFLIYVLFVGINLASITLLGKWQRYERTMT